MIYYIINESFTNIIAFVSILFAFAFTIAAIALGKNLLPRDAGRAYAINGSKSVGKPRGAGMIFILTFTVTCALFVNLSAELIIYLILVLAAMLSGYLDDSASSPWGNLKKGLIDLAISVMAAVTYLIRMLPLTLIRKEIKSTYIKSFLYYVPYVTLAAMTFPAILSATANIWSALAGFIIAVFLAYRGKSLLKVSLFACLGVFIVELITGL